MFHFIHVEVPCKLMELCLKIMELIVHCMLEAVLIHVRCPFKCCKAPVQLPLEIVYRHVVYLSCGGNVGRT